MGVHITLPASPPKGEVGKCRWLNFYGDTVDRYGVQVKRWAKRIKWNENYVNCREGVCIIMNRKKRMNRNAQLRIAQSLQDRIKL